MAHDTGADKAKPDDHKDKPDSKTVTIQIDRVNWVVPKGTMTAAELRNVPKPPIGSNRDLYEIRPNGDDKLLKDSDSFQTKEGLRFFTAPRQINPGTN